MGRLWECQNAPVVRSTRGVFWLRQSSSGKCPQSYFWPHVTNTIFVSFSTKNTHGAFPLGRLSSSKCTVPFWLRVLLTRQQRYSIIKRMFISCGALWVALPVRGVLLGWYKRDLQRVIVDGCVATRALLTRRLVTDVRLSGVALLEWEAFTTVSLGVFDFHVRAVKRCGGSGWELHCLCPMSKHGVKLCAVASG